MTLPDCMMPDGAEPCKSWTELRAENERLRDELDKAHRLFGKFIQWQRDTEIAKLRAALRVTREEERERCATIALEQRCDRGSPWDLACVTIAEKIRTSP